MRVGRVFLAATAVGVVGTSLAASPSHAGVGPITPHVAAAASSHHLTLDTSHDYGNKYADGVLPVGDGKYRTTGPKKGYVYACSQYAASLSSGNGGAGTRGPWFTDDNTEYDIDEKAHVSGNVSWPNATHSIKTADGKRKVTTNDLPTTHTTGVFPVAQSDPAYAYDRNPNSIAAQSLSLTLTKTPTYGSPHCMGGEVGVMTTGVLIFNAFDAGGRDAGAWEVQDHCDAHPQMQGEYHYHSLSSCITKLSVHHVIGWALDGFPITGPRVDGRHNQLSTGDLDVCHGITSKVKINGKSVKTYHYVMTRDFPYSVSCFRATPVTTGPVR